MPELLPSERAIQAYSLFPKKLYVRDTLRPQGVGSRLMEELRAPAATRPGCSRAGWTTDRDNPSARAFCRRPGLTEFNGKLVHRVDTGAACRRSEAHLRDRRRPPGGLPPT
ncbi:GNAT family N-acetyltransferase [Streptomyces sp. NPDC055186]